MGKMTISRLMEWLGVSRAAKREKCSWVHQLLLIRLCFAFFSRWATLAGDVAFWSSFGGGDRLLCHSEWKMSCLGDLLKIRSHHIIRKVSPQLLK